MSAAECFSVGGEGDGRVVVREAVMSGSPMFFVQFASATGQPQCVLSSTVLCAEVGCLGLLG